MDQTSGLRILFVDSTYATRETSGAFRIILQEQIEVSADQVLWIDEISVVGNVPQISSHNQNLYMVERTPKTFVWQVQRYSHRPGSPYAGFRGRRILGCILFLFFVLFYFLTRVFVRRHSDPR